MIYEGMITIGTTYMKLYSIEMVMVDGEGSVNAITVCYGRHGSSAEMIERVMWEDRACLTKNLHIRDEHVRYSITCIARQQLICSLIKSNIGRS